MMKRTFKRKLLISSLLVFSSLISAGCFELNYKDSDEYYEMFSDSVYLYYADEEGTTSKQVTKSIKDDLFNDDTANNVSKVKTINEEYYEYLCIKPSALVSVEDIALFVKAMETFKFEVRIYLLNELPNANEIRSFGLPGVDSDGKKISYEDEYTNPINVSTISTKENIWQSVYANRWTVSGKESRYVDVTITDYIVVQFLNNTGYGVDLRYQPVKFSIVNLLVSPKNEKYAIDEKD